MMQDDLANMFDRSMTFATTPNNRTSTPLAQSTTYDVSQHYHHSYHVATDSESSSKGKMSPQDTLRQNNIDPLHLLTSQLILFEHANADQRNRLIELWRISPPSQSRFDGLGGWNSTSMEQETELARIRYERRQADEHSNSVRDLPMEMNQQGAKLYIESGYQSIAEHDINRQSSPFAAKESFSPLGTAVGNNYRSATDPAFQSKEWWRGFMVEHPIEYQYGRFDQSRADEEML